MYPGRFSDVAFELPLCVDVKDKAAIWRQVTAHCGKHFFPVGEAPYVVNRIEHAENHVKPTVDSKVDHVLPVEFWSRYFLACKGKHLPRNIQPGYFVIILQTLQD